MSKTESILKELVWIVFFILSSIYSMRYANNGSQVQKYVRYYPLTFNIYSLN